ncbi:MAG TPA: hypothetical protein VGL56_08125 [Fimbriimonadaceae bacterium]|jgi:hypothetical protein
MKKIFLTLVLALLACLSFGQTWSEQVVNNNSLQIYWNLNGQAVQYGVIDLTSGYMRMNYGPGSGWATSVDVMPCFWSGGNLYQGYPVTAAYSVSGSNLVVRLLGTMQGLTTIAAVTFYPPYLNRFCAMVSATTSGTVALDNRPGEAFKPIFLSSMNDSATSWDSKSTFAGTTVANYPNTTGGWIIPGPSAVSATSWGVVGGTSAWKTNAPTISVTSTAAYPIAGYMSQDSNPNDDNVGFWASSTTVPKSWIFTVTASNGPSGGRNWNPVSSAMGNDGKERVLWAGTPFGTNPNQLAFWRVTLGGTPAVNVLPAFSSAYTPSFITVTPNGNEHILFRSLTGAIMVYHVTPSDTYTVNTFGPYANWTATGLTAQPNGDLNIEWTNTNGAVSIWDLASPSWTFTVGQYGPYPNLAPYAFTTGPTGSERVFWQETGGATPGEMTLSRMTSPGAANNSTFQPMAAGWQPSLIATGPNNYDRVFFSNAVSGQFQLWNLSPINVNKVTTFAARPGWWPVALSVASNNDPELTWVNSNGEFENWNINGAGSPTITVYGPY